MTKYSIDLSRFSLLNFKNLIRDRELFPSRMILKEELDTRFDQLEKAGIRDLKTLHNQLKTKAKMEVFGRQTGLSIKYLTILKREVNSYIARPVPLSGFPEIDAEYIVALKEVGLNNSKQLFEQAQSKERFLEILEKTGMPESVLLELFQLSNLVRIWGAGPVFARILYESGIRSVRKFLEKDPEPTFETLRDLNQERVYTSAHFTLQDIELCLEMAGHLELLGVDK